MGSSPLYLPSFLPSPSHPPQEEEEKGEELGLWASIVGLVVITAIVAVFSEFLVSSIDDVCRTYNISKVGARQDDAWIDLIGVVDL